MKYLNLFIPPIFKILINKIYQIHNNTNIKIIPCLHKISSYSQHQEDLIIDAILNKATVGFYVDIGAHDPTHLSNTLRFYLKGWRGINIEPQVICHNRFVRERGNDINLNIGIHKQKGELEFFHLELSSLSTFNYKNALKSSKQFNCKILGSELIPVCTLRDVFDKYLPKNQKIDFISIDTEGQEMDVLASNDWIKYRPKLIIIEFGKNEFLIYEYFKNIKYDLVYKNGLNAIFLDTNKIKFEL